MAKKTIFWTETHYYEAKIDIPDGLDPDEELDWVVNNTGEWSKGWHDPYDVTTDWDSFEIHEE